MSSGYLKSKTIGRLQLLAQEKWRKSVIIFQYLEKKNHRSVSAMFEQQIVWTSVFIMSRLSSVRPPKVFEISNLWYASVPFETVLSPVEFRNFFFSKKKTIRKRATNRRSIRLTNMTKYVHRSVRRYFVASLSCRPLFYRSLECTSTYRYLSMSAVHRFISI